MTPRRALAAGLAVLVALVLQGTVIPVLSPAMLVPNLCLLVAIAVGMSAGETAGMITGFAAGLALDLAPPADHLVGRWALALLLAGYLAGRLASGTPTRATAPATRRERAIGVGRIAALTAAASFVATSVFALSGLLFGELDWGVPELLRGIAASMLLDVGAALVVVPLVVRMLGLREAPVPAPDPAPDPTRDRTAAA